MQRRPVPISVAMPRFCSKCEIHQTTTTQPLCPVCLDKIRKEEDR